MPSASGCAPNCPRRRTPEPPADPVVVERYTALREWRKTRALERGVESDVIISKDALWTLAERAPDSLDEMDDVPGLGSLASGRLRHGDSGSDSPLSDVNTRRDTHEQQSAQKRRT